jgi:acetyl/propionyl-CoA carboxylase alpha subunit
MIAKLITYGKDRPEAIEFMRKALTNYRVVGLPTNLKFLKRVINEPVFNQGDYDTGYIDQNMATLLQKTSSVDSFSLLSAIIARTHHHNS